MGQKRRIFIALGCLLLVLTECNSQTTKETLSSDYTDNSIDLVPTYRTGIEKFLQGIAKVVSPNNSSNESQNSSDGGFGKFISSHIPKSIKNILSPVENITATGFGNILDVFEDHFHAIFPGTLWCGGGHIAKSEKDVGLFERTDKCCRAHDNCPLNISAGSTKENLINNGIFTRSACTCDHEFYKCLKDVDSLVSTNIGTTYFNILRPQCFSYDYPITSCAKYGRSRLIHKKCVQYNLDESQNKTLEWFDNPDFL